MIHRLPLTPSRLDRIYRKLESASVYNGAPSAQSHRGGSAAPPGHPHLAQHIVQLNLTPQRIPASLFCLLPHCYLCVIRELGVTFSHMGGRATSGGGSQKTWIHPPGDVRVSSRTWFLGLCFEKTERFTLDVFPTQLELGCLVRAVHLLNGREALPVRKPSPRELITSDVAGFLPQVTACVPGESNPRFWTKRPCSVAVLCAILG